MERFKKVYLVKKLNDPTSGIVSSITEAILGIDNIKVETIEKNIDHTTLIVAIGGDGTMLYASKLSAQYGGVAIGVNIGRVGFLTDFPPRHIEKVIHHLISSDDLSSFDIEERSLVWVQPYLTDIEGFFALNEITIAHSESDSMIECKLRINGKETGKHRANSMIVSTPTGSTAYALSAGGSIIIPSLNVLEIVPVAPSTMASRPLIVSGNSVIEIDARVPENESISVRIDGRIKLKTDFHMESFTITNYKNPAKLIHHGDWNFFETLSSKLNWNK